MVATQLEGKNFVGSKRKLDQEENVDEYPDKFKKSKTNEDLKKEVEKKVEDKDKDFAGQDAA